MYGSLLGLLRNNVSFNVYMHQLFYLKVKKVHYLCRIKFQ